VAIAGGDGRPSLVPILLVHDAAGQPQLLVGQRGGDAVLRVRLRAARWRLRAPELALPGALAAYREGAPPAAARLDAALRGDTLRLAVVAGGTRRVATARLTPGTAWRLLPAPGAWGPERRAPSALWLAAALAPFGYWLGRAAARGGAARAGALAAAVVAGGLWGVPAAAGHAAAPWWEWAGAALGVTAAWAAAWAAARPARPPAPDPTAPDLAAPGRPAPGRPAPGSAERRVAARSGPGQLSPP
jgi:hypothetical protein